MPADLSMARRALTAGAALAIAATGANRLEAQAPPTRPADAEAFQPIEVVGLANPERLSPDDLKRAYAAFVKWRPVLAPGALLYLVPSARSAPQALSGLKLRVVDERTDAIIDVPLDAAGRAPVPDLDYASHRYGLLANRKAGTLGLDVVAYSSGTDSAHRRMGDLRLQCRVWWALIGPRVPLPVKAMFGLAGGPCSSSKIGLYTHAERPIADAQIIAGPRRWPVRVLQDRRRFRAPIYDKSIPNEAVLTVTYAS